MADTKKEHREAVREAVATAGSIAVKVLVDKVGETGVPASEAKAAARHLVQSGSIAFDDQMKLVECKRESE